MLRLIMESGPMFWPILLISLVILVLFGIGAARLSSGRATRRSKAGIDVILFWGGVATVLGFLGQCLGLWKGFRVMAREGPVHGVNPAAVAMGISESLHTTIFGLTVLIAASLAWLILTTWWRRLDGESAE